MTELPPLQNDVLPSGIRSRFVRDINGLKMHVLEAGFETRGRPYWVKKTFFRSKLILALLILIKL